MSDLSNLERSIREKIEAQQKKMQQEQQALAHEMAELEQRQTEFQQAADRLMKSVIRPRIEKLAELFPNAELAQFDNGNRNHCVCSFQHTPEYPATVTLDIGIGHDQSIKDLLIVYDLEILPIFFKFPSHQQMAVPIADLQDEKLEHWLDERILEFVDTYLRLGQTEQYQKETMVTDPVCGMRLRKSLTSASEIFQGHEYRFCTELCQSKFVADPERYISTNQTPAQKHSVGQSQQEELQRESDELKEFDGTIQQLKHRVEDQFGAK